jgi:hypothetical protein
MNTRTYWDNYFTGTPSLIQPKEYGATQTLSGTNLYIFNCLFRSVTSSNYGGAFYCTSVTYLLVESSSFLSCRTNAQCGGAIYFSNGQCVLDGVCGYDCYSTYTTSPQYQFAYICVNDATSNKNNVNYSSIVRCVNGRPESYYTLGLFWGKICCQSVNISMNECLHHSGIYCTPYKDSNSVTCSISYSSITDNTANGHICIQFWQDGANCEMKSCNILRNTQGSLDSIGIIFTNSNLKIEDSCILENKADCIFNQGSSFIITLSNCTVDSTNHYNSFTIQNTVTKSFILGLNHVLTQNCHSEYDSVGYLTPFIQHQSHIKCYTYRKCSCQSQQFSIIFVFNFIHSY